MNMSEQAGFTLFEIILSILAVGILAGIVLIAIRPTSQLSDARNNERNVDLSSILNAIYQYTLGNGGIVPANLTTTTCSLAVNEVCKTGIATTTCASNNLVDLSLLTNNGKYIPSIPIDPMGGEQANGTGYHVVKTTGNKIEVCAPKAENGATIDIQR